VPIAAPGHRGGQRQKRVQEHPEDPAGTAAARRRRARARDTHFADV